MPSPAKARPLCCIILGENCREITAAVDDSNGLDAIRSDPIKDDGRINDERVNTVDEISRGRPRCG